MHTIPEAAKLLRVKTATLRRAVNLGLVPHYSCFNSRKLVKPAEVLAAMASYQKEAFNGWAPDPLISGIWRDSGFARRPDR